MAESKILVIGGMHRSGTSLVGNWLARCGLHLGDELIPADFSNPAGHFEDRGFVQLHRAILADNGLDHLVVRQPSLAISAEHRADAENMITARQGFTQWGWKDPRTALLLGFWRDLRPDLKVLVVYRNFGGVVESMLRRERKRELKCLNRYALRNQLQTTRKLAFLRHIPGLLAVVGAVEPLLRAGTVHLRYSQFNLPRAARYLRVWRTYNRALLADAAAHPDAVLLLHIDDLLANSPQVIAALNRRWGFKLEKVDVHDVYVEGLLQSRPQVIVQVLARFLPGCHATLRALDAARRQALARLEQE